VSHDFNEEVKAKKTEALIEVISEFFQQNIKNILVVGCGSGREAGMLARAFKADATGIDVGNDFSFDHQGSAPATLLSMDARELKFADNSFDMVFSFHALEHIPEPQRAINEMGRVLQPGGIYLIAAPNKSRLIGGFTSPHPLRFKLLWNAKDLWLRLTGRWSNEEGAHAGFTVAELTNYCSMAFGNATDISVRYYRSLHSRHRTAISAVTKSGLQNIVFPGVFIAGTKPSQ